MREHALLRALLQEFHQINAANLGRSLRAPVFALADQGPAGAWIRPLRQIRFSRAWVEAADWGQISEVLRHEMAHQYVCEVLGQRGEQPHGPAFAHVCRQLGISARATGAVGGVPAEEPAELRRVRKLLALAASANSHEAEAAMAHAQRLMRKRTIDHVDSGHQRSFVVGNVGRSALRYHAWETALLGLLCSHFHVQGLISRSFEVSAAEWRQVLEIHGTPENVAFAQYVYDFVAQATLRLFEERRTSLPARAGARAQFALGVVQGFRRKLEESEQDLRQAGLVWRGDAALEAHLGCRYPHLSKRLTQGSVTEATRAGFTAGQDLTLHRPLERGPDGVPRALTGR